MRKKTPCIFFEHTHNLPQNPNNHQDGQNNGNQNNDNQDDQNNGDHWAGVSSARWGTNGLGVEEASLNEHRTVQHTVCYTLYNISLNEHTRCNTEQCNTVCYTLQYIATV